jgi:hypothetical protein
MRLAKLALVGVVAFASMAASTTAAPFIANQRPHPNSHAIQVWGGWGFHPTRWGRCVPNHWGYGWHRPYYRYRPYWGHYYGGGYYPY